MEGSTIIFRQIARNIFIFLFIWIHNSVFTQTVENVRAITKGDIIEIYYDLKPGIDSLNSNITIFSSHNNYQVPLLWVTGHVGQLIPPGDNKLVIWEARKELDNFKGELIIEVRAEPVAMLYEFNSHKKLLARPGKNFTVSWKGGKKTDIVDIQLLDAEKKIVNVLSSTSNANQFTWNIPKDFKRGTYYLLLKAPGQELRSEPIKIQRSKKWLLILPIVGGIGFLAGSLGNKEELLPTPPGPPSNN